MLRKSSFYVLSNLRKSFAFHSRRNRSVYQRISNLKPNHDSVAVKGWVCSLRKMKELIFVDVMDGSSSQPLQVVIPKNEAPDSLSYGSAVEVKGDLVENNSSQIEMINGELKVVGICSLEGFPFGPKKKYTNDYVRQYLHLRPRYVGINSLYRIRNEAVLAINSYFNEKGYINVQAPILTSNDCEGASEVFTVEKAFPAKQYKNPPQTPNKFFDEEVYLTVSGQLHLEAAVRGLGQVYSFGPTFRAENSKSRLHLSEFYMLEAETIYLQSMDELTGALEELIHYITYKLIKNCSTDLEKCRQYLGDPNLTDSLKNFDDMMSPFSRMTYKEGSEILLNNGDKLKTKFSEGQSFTKDQELFLVKHNNNVPIFVVEWPQNLKPFYMKSMKNDSKTVMAFDLLCPNVGEICGGSFREDDYDTLEAVLRKKKSLASFDWYLELRKYGNVASCGYGLGFERYLQVLLQILNIKDVIPFPRWPHNCQL